MSVIIEDMTMPECCMKCPMKTGYGCGYMGIAMATKDMKSGRHPDCPLEEADDGWIPCEDRLPKEERWVYFMETEKDVEIAWYAGGWFKTNNDLAWTDSKDCLYWKYIPLPKPYKPKEDK